MATNLNFMRCIFFTNQQFNIDKIHIPMHSLYIDKEIFINNNNDLEIEINKIIDEIYINLNKNNQGSPIKIPAPIFTIIGRKLDYDKSIFDNELFETSYKTPFNYGNSRINPDNTGKLAIISYFQSFFKSGLGEMPKDEDNYKASLINSYKFKGKRKILLYVPYLTNNYKYISNFTDIMNSTRFFFSLIANDNFLNFKKTTKITYDELKKKFKGYSEENILRLLNKLKKEDEKIYTLYEDLIKLCNDGGCISDDGEDFSRLVPEYTDDEGRNNENAIKYSPYLPNKCLAQTDGFINNIQKGNRDNLELSEFLKKNAIKEIKQKLNIYLDASVKIANGANPDDVKSSDISNFNSPVDLIIAIINRYIKDYYSTNLNDGDRDGIRLNYYSKEYSKNIIKELSLLRKFYPGIPEIILSLYLFKENLKSDKITYMPWGRKLISKRNVLNLGELLEINKSLFSFNNRYILTIRNNGIIYVYDNNNGNILYFINKNPINNSQGIIFETTALNVEFIDQDNNLKSRDIFKNLNIKSFIGDCEECKDPPYSLILDDFGNINIYANSFYDATNKDFKEFIKKEIDYMNDLRRRGYSDNLNINDPNFNENKIEIIAKEEDYIYCFDKRDSCKK